MAKPSSPLARVVVAAAAAAIAGGACVPDGGVDKEPLPFAPADADNAPDPAKVGPYPVGVRTTVMVDDFRLEEDGQPRTLPLEIWYPAQERARDG